MSDGRANALPCPPLAMPMLQCTLPLHKGVLRRKHLNRICCSCRNVHCYFAKAQFFYNVHYPENDFTNIVWKTCWKTGVWEASEA